MSSFKIPQADLVRWTQAFIRYPSVQTEKFERDPQVLGFIRECVEPLVRELHLPFRYDGMGNMLIEIGPEDPERSLLLMGYAMTHPANRMSDPFSGNLVEIDGQTKVRGRGVSEQKGSLVAAIAATKAAMDDGKLKGRLILGVSTAGETGRHDAAIAMCDALGYFPRKGVIVIGTSGQVSAANKGRIDVIVTVRGKASHSSMPWVGLNAIEGARAVLDRVCNIDVQSKRHPGLGTATLTATSLRSWPEATHTVQDEVRLVFDRRLLPGDDPELAFNVIRDAADLGSPWSITTEFGPFMYPAELDENGELFTAIREGCRRQGLDAPSSFYCHGALDAGYLSANGCEATMWGPGNMEQWHSEEEAISVRDLSIGAEAYYGLIQAYL